MSAIPAAKKSFLRSRAWQAFQVALVILLFALIYWYQGAEIEKAVRNFDPLYLSLAFAVYFICLLLTFVRWQVLVQAQGLPFSIYDAIRLGFVGAITSLFLPGSITGDLVKASFIATEQKRRVVAVSTILIDRVAGLYALLLLTSLIGMVFWDEVTQFELLRVLVLFVWAVTGGAALAVLAILFFRAEPLIAWLESFRWGGRQLAELVRVLQLYKHQPGTVALVLVLGLVGHVGFVMTFQLAARAVTPQPPSWELQFLIIPAYMVAASVPLTPLGGLGVGEAMLGGLYKIIGAPVGLGASVALAQRTVSWLAAAVGLIWYLPLQRTLRMKLREVEEQRQPLEVEPTPSEFANGKPSA